MQTGNYTWSCSYGQEMAHGKTAKDAYERISGSWNWSDIQAAFESELNRELASLRGTPSSFDVNVFVQPIKTRSGRTPKESHIYFTAKLED